MEATQRPEERKILVDQEIWKKERYYRNPRIGRIKGFIRMCFSKGIIDQSRSDGFGNQKIAWIERFGRTGIL
ncbi:hypothetical protein B5G34_14315 [Flavonifractor sp. An82]|uniref:hypothetical protein n=1 Tax=Flavonifractor sp. An82 TaxID=1965660 RepID=UPI000B381F0D|nr:hypothetical protein [Flavonifractor sp. An82]OUN20523.1 hypothetical protein B5G34_14315 [Flavonifractor sp. An82]